MRASLDDDRKIAGDLFGEQLQGTGTHQVRCVAVDHPPWITGVERVTCHVEASTSGRGTNGEAVAFAASGTVRPGWALWEMVGPWPWSAQIGPWCACIALSVADICTTTVGGDEVDFEEFVTADEDVVEVAGGDDARRQCSACDGSISSTISSRSSSTIAHALVVMPKLSAVTLKRCSKPLCVRILPLVPFRGFRSPGKDVEEIATRLDCCSNGVRRAPIHREYRLRNAFLWL